MNESQYINLQVKKWRALTYNWDALWSQGDTSRLYCLTDFQVAWLLSNTEYMRWSSRWEDCPCTQNDLEAMKAELDFNLMSCIDIQPYQLQYLYQQAQDEYFARLNALWDIDPTPSEINPSTPDDFYSGDDSPERIDALCTACKIYVYSYAQNWCTKAQIILGIVGVIGLFASITIVGGVVASVLVGGLAYITSLALDAMHDENALDDIACCMATTLDGLAITNANFEIALDSCSFIPGSKNSIARDIIASDLNVFSNWLGFLDTLGNAYDLALIGVSDCPMCADSECESRGNSFPDGLGDYTYYSTSAIYAGNALFIGGTWNDSVGRTAVGCIQATMNGVGNGKDASVYIDLGQMCYVESIIGWSNRVGTGGNPVRWATWDDDGVMIDQGSSNGGNNAWASFGATIGYSARYIVFDAGCTLSANHYLDDIQVNVV